MKNGLIEHPKQESELGTRRLENIDLIEELEVTPYEFKASIEGVVPILFNRWDCDKQEARGGSPPGSKERNTDDPKTMVYRMNDGTLGIPNYVVHGALSAAGKYMKDPRSSKKSAVDLIKAAILISPMMIPFGKKTWDFVDARRVRVNGRGAITRHRPALKEGWKLAFTITVLAPSLMGNDFLLELVTNAGRFCGIGDYHPVFGRFKVTKFENITTK